MSSRAAVLSFVTGLGFCFCCCRCSSTTMASHRGVVRPGKMGDSVAVSVMLKRMLMLTEWEFCAFTETKRWLPLLPMDRVKYK